MSEGAQSYQEEQLYAAIRELDRGIRENEGATWEAWQWATIGMRVAALKAAARGEDIEDMSL